MNKCIFSLHQFDQENHKLKDRLNHMMVAHAGSP